MKNKLKRFYLPCALSLGAMLLMAGCGAGSDLKEELPMEAMPELTSVTVNTTVRPTGQYPESFVISFDSDLVGKELDPAAFSMTGKAGQWGSDDLKSFECSFESAKVEGNTLTLVPDNFPEKYFYVRDFTVSCEGHPEFDFTEEKVAKVVTPVADDFETLSNTDGISFDYHLFTPAETENMPVVVVFHGYGDTSNLLTYKTAVEWAEPDNQKERPCYVLAPVIKDEPYFKPAERDKIYTAVKGILDGMVAEGKADPDRIYVMGNSFGGMATVEFCEKYPDAVAGALALCPALNYATNATMNLKNMTNVPIWFAHATNDNTIPVSTSQIAFASLQKLGAKEVKFTEYTDDEMNAAGADPAPDATYSYHHVELAVMEDDTYMEWLYEKTAKP